MEGPEVGSERDKSNSSSPISVVASFWKDFDLEKEKSFLDEQGLRIAENQDNSQKNRRKLAESTRDFKKAPPEEKLHLFNSLLKGYQEEVDNITKRAKFGENAFLNIYQKLYEVPDPYPALASIAEQYSKLSDLESENRKMKLELEEYRTEATHLKNQQATIRRLEERNRQLELQDSIWCLSYSFLFLFCNIIVMIWHCVGPSRRSSSSSGSKSRSRSRSKSKSRSRSRSRSRSWSYEHRHSYRRNRSYRNWSPEHPKRTRTIRKSPPNHSKSPIDYKKGSWHTLADWEKPVSPGGTIIQRNLNHPPPRFNGPPPNIYAKKCADFEEKGFCMKGDLCMFDHGTDPVVLDNVDSVPFSLPVQPDVLHPSGPDSLYANPMVNLQGPLLGPPPSNLEYNPAAPNMEPWPPSNYIGGPFNNRGPLNKQRELISVPTSAKAGLQDFTRSDSLQKPKSFNQQNIPTNSLLLKKIPTHLNNISRLNNHFYKFGRINKIQVFYEGQPDAALITFSSVAEAQAAYRSPEPILNNRFIKMFYYQTDKSLVNGKIQDSIANKRNVGNTSAVNMQLNRPKVPETSNGATPKQMDSTTTFQKTGAYNLVKDPGRKPVVEKLNVLKKTVTIYKKKQELLQKLIKQQKDLILLIEKGSLSEEQRSKIFETISSLQVQIEGIKESIKEAQADMSKTASLIKSKPGTQLVKSEPKVKTEPVEQSEAAEKVEIKGESSDADSAEKPSAENQSDSKASKENEADSSQPQKKQALTEMQRKILDLKKQMQALTDSKTLAQSLKKPFFNNPNKFSRNLTFTRNPTAPETTKKNVFALSNPTTTAPAQPSKFPAAANVDHRPTKLLISGYEYDDETELLQNLAAFGEIEDYISDPTTPSIIVSYKTRKEAEIALVKGKMFKDRKLSIMWYNEPVPYKAMKRTLSCSSDHSTDKSFQDDITSPDHYSYSRKFDSSHEDDSDCDRKSDRDIDEKLDLKSDSSQREFDWNRLSH